jgi:hypothetical protein
MQANYSFLITGEEEGEKMTKVPGYPKGGDEFIFLELPGLHYISNARHFTHLFTFHNNPARMAYFKISQK